MLTKEQIKIWSSRENIGLGIVERDYIQQIFLCLLYSRHRDFVFKGGTCLKFAYKLNRYSEDLDFNYDFSLAEGLKILEDIAKRMETYGVLVEVRNKKGKGNQGFGFDLSYQGQGCFSSCADNKSCSLCGAFSTVSSVSNLKNRIP